MGDLAPSRRSDVTLAVIGAGIGLAAGILAARSVVDGALLVGAALLLATILIRPVVVGMIACVGVFAAYRAGAGAGLPVGGNGVSYSDVLLAVAAVIAVPSLVGALHRDRLRIVGVGLAVYLACLLPTVLVDGSSRGWFEWAHRLVLVGGSVIVGFWVSREGRARATLRALVAVAVVVAVAAMIDALQNGFEPAYPLELHKNFAGAQLSMTLVVLIGARRTHGLRLPIEVLLVVVLAGGLLATQSRGAMLAAGVALIMTAAFSPRTNTRRVRAVLVVVTLILAGFVYFSVRSQLSLDQQDLNNSSIGVRQQVEKRSREIWQTSPVYGVGLKYFNTGEWGKLAQPPNIVVDNELAESGLIGLGGFVVLQVSAVAAGLRRRRKNHLAVVGAACVAGALVHGMVDIYWIAGSITLPFVLLGMGLGAPESDEPPPPAPGHRQDARGRITGGLARLSSG